MEHMEMSRTYSKVGGQDSFISLPSHLHVCHVGLHFSSSASCPSNDQERFRKDPAEINFEIILTLVGVKLGLNAKRWKSTQW